MRASRVPLPIGCAGTLVATAAAVPSGDGAAAWVLDRPGADRWRLREIDLATCSVLSELASGSDGEPRAMALELGGGSLLVALQRGESWAILRVRVDLKPGAEPEPPVELLDAGKLAVPEPGPVRGIASLGKNAALITAGSSLLRLDVSDPARARLAPILRGLKTPWGILRDPLRPNRVYLAERDWEDPGGGGAAPGRILSLNLNTLSSTEVVAKGLELPRPESLALERRGTRLLAVTDDGGDGIHELRGVDLGGESGGETFEIARGGAGGVGGLEGDIGSLATGPDGLRLLALTSSGGLAVGGGVEQRREIVRFDASRKEVGVREAFRPPLRPLEHWRIVLSTRQVVASPEGTKGIFVWDSEQDLPEGGFVVVKVAPYDEHRGIGDETFLPREFDQQLFEEEPLVLSSEPASAGNALAAADLDRDGDLDLVVAGERQTNTEPPEFADTVRLYFQKGRRVFGLDDDPADGIPPQPDLVLEDQAGRMRWPYVADIADMNGDRRLDIVTANLAGHTLTLFYQDASGSFNQTSASLALSLPLHPTSPVNGPPWVKAADLNGDGLLDLAAANWCNSGVLIFHQTVDGFRPQYDVEVGDPCPMRCDVADLDGDGDLDLATSYNYDTRALDILVQESPSRFQRKQGLSGRDVIQRTDLEAVDIDLDGDLDLILSQASTDPAITSAVTIFPQEGSRFDARTAIPVGHRWPKHEMHNGKRVAAVADLDSDGDLDIVYPAFSDHQLWLFLQRGPYAFDQAIAFGQPAVPAFKQPETVIVADFDSDGRPDIVSANREGKNATIFFHKGPGEFDTEPLVVCGPEQDAPSDVDAADLDGDGDLDLVGAFSSNHTLKVFFQLSLGFFSPVPRMLSHEDMKSPLAVVARDLDGDRKVDLASANPTSHTLTVFFQEAPGVFQGEPVVLGSIVTTRSPWDLAAADLDGDGRMDLVAADLSNDRLVVFFQEGPRQFGKAGAVEGIWEPSLSLEDPNTLDRPVSVAAADLNGDGLLDLVAANSSSDSLSLYFQTGRREFAAAPQKLGNAATTDYPTSVKAADIDGDGRPDLVCANARGNAQLAVFLQRAPGVFGRDGMLPDTIIESGDVAFQPNSIDLGDVDADGDLDLLSANFQGPALTVFLQTTPGAFSKNPIVVATARVPPGNAWIQAADIDGDGDLDLVLADAGSRILEVFFNSH